MEIESLGVVCTWRSGNPNETSASFGVEEFAVLTSGERISLHTDRGWSAGILHRIGTPEVPYWGGPMRGLDSLVRDIYSTLLPEEGDGDHDWDRLVSILADKGQPVTADDLRVLPYTVEVSPNMRAVLSAADMDRQPLQVDWSELTDR